MHAYYILVFDVGRLEGYPGQRLHVLSENAQDGVEASLSSARDSGQSEWLGTVRRAVSIQGRSLSTIFQVRSLGKGSNEKIRRKIVELRHFRRPIGQEASTQTKNT